MSNYATTLNTSAVRVQLRRTKGWRMPPNTVNVARPSVWGNPFWHAQKVWSLEASLRLYRRMVEGGWSPSNIEGSPGNVGSIAYEQQQEWCKRLCGHPLERARVELRGKNLACWCALDKPCHADILLEIANG